MQRTYAQKNETAQRAADNTAAAVHDNSPQSECLQRHASLANAAVQRAENPPRPNNTGLPDDLKNGVESLSGFSMDDVRVHYNSDKPATVQALAYTQGNDIHVAPGQEHALPHEAWHVTQQMAGRVSPTTNINGMPVNDNATLEHEADVMGEKAVQCKRVGEENVIKGYSSYCSNVKQLATCTENFRKNHVVANNVYDLLKKKYDVSKMTWGHDDYVTAVYNVICNNGNNVGVELKIIIKNVIQNQTQFVNSVRGFSGANFESERKKIIKKNIVQVVKNWVESNNEAKKKANDRGQYNSVISEAILNDVEINGAPVDCYSYGGSASSFEKKQQKVWFDYGVNNVENIYHLGPNVEYDFDCCCKKGSGTVQKDKSGSDKGYDCYELKAKPDKGWQFQCWKKYDIYKRQEDDTVIYESEKCNVKVDAPCRYRAYFEQKKEGK